MKRLCKKINYKNLSSFGKNTKFATKFANIPIQYINMPQINLSKRFYVDYQEMKGNYDDIFDPYSGDPQDFVEPTPTRSNPPPQQAPRTQAPPQQPIQRAQPQQTYTQPQSIVTKIPSLSNEYGQEITATLSAYDLIDLEILKTISKQPFSKEIAEVLLKPIDPKDVEIKPDGILYLPEIKYRRILNQAFGPGGWALLPRGDHGKSGNTISREYALFAHGRFIAQAKGDHETQTGIFIEGAAEESAKSRALMRCCKDLGVASELWDPVFIQEFKTKYVVGVYAEHVKTKVKKMLYRRKDRPVFTYPYDERKTTQSTTTTNSTYAPRTTTTTTAQRTTQQPPQNN